jgi:hypothetical protein
MNTTGAKVISETVVLLAPKLYLADSQTVADLCGTILASRPYRAEEDAGKPMTRSPLVAARLLGYKPSTSTRRRYGYTTS